MADTSKDRVEKDLNADAITGAPGSHPVGSGLGAAAGGAAAGVVAGAVGGPVGAAIGAVVGGVAGGLAGKAVAEQVDPTVEHAYWEGEFKNREYFDGNADYDSTYKPAYQHGWESRVKYDGKSFEQAEAEMQKEWEATKYRENMEWERARRPAHDAWERTDVFIRKTS